MLAQEQSVKRYEEAKTIHGTMEYNFIDPISDNNEEPKKICCLLYSKALDSVNVKIRK